MKLSSCSQLHYHLPTIHQYIHTLRPRHNCHDFAVETFKHILLNENVRISFKISLEFVPSSPINNIPPLVQIMAWRQPGDRPLSKPMMINLQTHMCITQPLLVNGKWTFVHTKICRIATMWKKNPETTHAHRFYATLLISWCAPVGSEKISQSLQWPLTHWGWDKMDTILQMTLSNEFLWIKMLEFRLIFHWSLFLRV